MPRRGSLASRPLVPRLALASMALGALLLSIQARPALAQGGQGGTPRAGGRTPPPSIADRTAGMRRIDGFFPLYWDSVAGALFMEIPRFNTEVLHATGLAAGLGSNDIGLDRGQGQGSRIVSFERVGPKVLMVQPNYDFRSTSDNPAEVRAVRDAFARSVLWGFTVAAESDGRVLVDMSEFLLRDGTNMAQQLRPGSYRLDTSRSTIYMPMTMGFPKNTEMEAELTFVSQPGGGQGGGGFGGGGAFEGVGSVAATGEAASLRLHHSFIELPDRGYTPRAYDPRSGYFAEQWRDYSAPLDREQTQRVIARHRLEKKDPAARVSDPVKPIIYYLDPGTPEPIRSALLEGARWWNQAFEAAGYRNAFQVQLLPEGVSSHDIRYNVINWVHRSTRGWSYGGSITDPRTGEIIKGVVTLGSLRVRQDWMIAEGLLQPYANGDQVPENIRQFALQRMKQLSAHEVGHTLGLGHNYYDSEQGRISVLDYPHPLVTLRPDGTLDASQAYTNEIGEWDKVAIAYGYQDFPEGTDEAKALREILDRAWQRDVRYMTNQDLGAHPRVDQWSNGTDAAAELRRMMEVRRVALSRFGENAIRSGRPMAQLEETLVPLYMHHRYQVEATAATLGGQHYIYALKGDGRPPFRRASAAEQRGALDALLATISPASLALPQALLAKIPPRPSGYGRSRELFPRWTGPTFDAITPAVVGAEHTVSFLLDPGRAARLVEQRALDASLPGFADVVAALVKTTFEARDDSPYEAEVRRAVQWVVVENLVDLAGGAPMPAVRAEAALTLRDLRERLGSASSAGDRAGAAHATLLASEIQRFLERPAQPGQRLSVPQPPPGAPIGEPAMEWISRRSAARALLADLEAPCTHWGMPW